MSQTNSPWQAQGPTLTVEQLQAAVGSTMKTHTFKVDLAQLEAYRSSVYDYQAYPKETNPDYPIEQLNFCYLLSLVDTLRVQLFVDDPRYLTLTSTIGEAKITKPIYTSDELVMECDVEKVTEVRGKYWCMFTYRFIKVGEDAPCAVSKQTVCLVPR